MMPYLLSEPLEDLVGVASEVFGWYCVVLADVRNGKTIKGVAYSNPDRELRDFRSEVLGQLVEDGHAKIGDDGKYVLTEDGMKYVASVLDD